MLHKKFPNLNLEPQPISYNEYIQKLDVKRVNTLLNVEKLQNSGFITSSASDAVAWCMNNYGVAI